MKLIFLTTLALAAAFTVTACATTTQTDMTAGTDTDVIAAAGAETSPDEGVTAEGTPFRCERIQVTGPRRYERICYSREQWEAMVRDTQANVREIQSGSRGDARGAEYSGPGS